MFVLKLINKPITFRRLHKIKYINQRSVSYQTIHIVSSLDAAESYDARNQYLENFVKHLENHPIERYTAINEGAVSILKSIAKTSSEQKVIENARLGLALLGYPGKLKSNGIRILSIDGGGIRAIVVMELLRKLEEMTNMKIFQLFDFVCGVSTGSVLICGLAADRNLTLTQALTLYKQISHKVFHRPTSYDFLSGTSRLLWTHAYYDSDLWEELLQKHMSRYRLIDTSKFTHVPKFCCVSTTISENIIEAHIHRNYVLPCNVQSVYPGDHTAELWQVVRASTAAPAYFADFLLNNQLHQDGGILFNNPTAVAIHEAKLLWPDEKIQCVVSVGTGRPPNKSRSDGQKLYNAEFDVDKSISSWTTKFRRILDSATDTEATHTALSDLLPPGRYFRFNPYLTEWISMVELRAEKYALMERDALLYYRKNEDKFEQAAAHLKEKRSLPRRLYDAVNFSKYFTDEFHLHQQRQMNADDKKNQP